MIFFIFAIQVRNPLLNVKLKIIGIYIVQKWKREGEIKNLKKNTTKTNEQIDY